MYEICMYMARDQSPGFISSHSNMDDPSVPCFVGRMGPRGPPNPWANRGCSAASVMNGI